MKHGKVNTKLILELRNADPEDSFFDIAARSSGLHGREKTHATDVAVAVFRATRPYSPEQLFMAYCIQNAIEKRAPRDIATMLEKHFEQVPPWLQE